jgi:hypothetical protein
MAFLIVDRQLGRTNQFLLRHRFEFDLFRKRHSIAGQIEMCQNPAPKHPHSRLRIAHAKPEQKQNEKVEHIVAKDAQPIAGFVLVSRTIARDKVESFVNHHVEQNRDEIARVGAVGVHRNNDVAGGSAQAGFVRRSITLLRFVNHSGAKTSCHLRRVIGRVVVHRDYFVHDVAIEVAKHFDQTAFFIETWQDQ